MNVRISREFDKTLIPNSLKEYSDRIGYMFALTGVVNFLSHSNSWYEVEIDWAYNDEKRGLCYVIHLWYGCDNWSMNESVTVHKEDNNYITIADEDYNNSALTN